MVRFIIVRHGVTDFNKENRYQGQFDSSLAPVGIEQARITAEHITKQYHIDAIYSSDLSRAMKTAEPFAKHFGIEKSRAVTYRGDREGTKLNYEVIHDAVASGRKCESIP